MEGEQTMQNSLSRRKFVQQTSKSAAVGLVAGVQVVGAEQKPNTGGLHLAPFRFDVTPPKGHSLCGGWITPVVAVDDPLEAIGFVLLGAGPPIVLCSVDWTGLLNRAHINCRTALAEAAGTTADRVAVQCVHQHNAPFACLDAERLVAEQGDLPHIVELDFFRRCLDRGRMAIEQAVRNPKPVTHVAHGQARVEKVASNRRVFRDEQGHVKSMRSSSCRDAQLRALPEGLIDPWLKTVAFYNRDKKIAACHYYATHPMSYYGDGRVSSDFAGLARKQRQADEPDCLHVYFTGCAGNIAAGKYNDGSKGVRPVLTGRVYDGIVRSEEGLQPRPIESLQWRTVDFLPPPRSTFSSEDLRKQIENHSNLVRDRNRPSYMLSWLQRVERETPIVLSALHIGDISVLHLPAECFIQYQLRAQQMQPSRFVATAAYGDGGPWYIPVEEEYPHGGYEVGVAFCDPEVDSILTTRIKKLLS